MIKVVDDCIRSSAIEKIGEFCIKNGIRTLRQEQNIALWLKRVEECNSSGLSAAKWCSEYGALVEHLGRFKLNTPVANG